MTTTTTTTLTILYTDMIPNAGVTDGKGLFDMAAENATKHKIYSTFIGKFIEDLFVIVFRLSNQ